MHPAVLLKYLRLRTAVRLFVKNSQDFWSIAFAGKVHPKSWLGAVERDIVWLARCGSTFSDIKSPAEFFAAVKSNHRLVVAGLKKACGDPAARAEAIADLPHVRNNASAPSMDIDAMTLHQCGECEYFADTARALNMHGVAFHGKLSSLHRTVDDSPWRTVCGLLFGDRTRVVQHLQESNAICRLNYHLRGEWLSAAQAREFCNVDARRRLDRKNQGSQKHFADLSCVRTFGPHWPTTGLSGLCIVSDNSSPTVLGGKKWLPVRLTIGF